MFAESKKARDRRIVYREPFDVNRGISPEGCGASSALLNYDVRLVGGGISVKWESVKPTSNYGGWVFEWVISRVKLE